MLLYLKLDPVYADACSRRTCDVYPRLGSSGSFARFRFAVTTIGAMRCRSSKGRDRLEVTDAVVHAEIHVAGNNAGELEPVCDADRHTIRDLAGERDVRSLASLDEHARRQSPIREHRRARRIPRRPQPRLREVEAGVVRGAEKLVGVAGHVFGDVLEPDQAADRRLR